ncbi:MAG: HD domain-containing protein [Ruminococcus sp.]|nr:HD domain-containing protein [Ruminococcus sp.]
MIYTELTNKAMRIAYKAHNGQYDVNGVPYIFHPYHVAEQMSDEISTCAALLHDVAEDTAVTLEMLEQEFPPEVTDALKLLTHEKGTDYFEYVERIRENAVARAVKLADLEHNSDTSRITDKNAVSAEKLAHWKYKYSTARKILEEDNTITQEQSENTKRQ